MGTLHVIVPFCPMSEVESLLELAVQTRDSESTTCESMSGQHTQREIYSVNYTFDLENEMSKKDDFKVKICKSCLLFWANLEHLNFSNCQVKGDTFLEPSWYLLKKVNMKTKYENKVNMKTSHRPIPRDVLFNIVLIISNHVRLWLQTAVKSV